MDLNYLQKRTWAEVDLDALEHNYKILREHIPQTSKLCCIIKADAYGHGSVRVARLYEALGADFLAVSNIEEALTVRKADVKTPLLILGYTHPSCAPILAENNISQCVYSYEYGKALEKSAKAADVKLLIHLKVDVGMGRLGFVFRDGDENAFSQALEICNSEQFITEGIFTHFPMADSGLAKRSVTKKQYERFSTIIKRFNDNGIEFDIKHCSNSAAAIDFPEYSMDMVRLGIALYGVSPVKDIYKLDLKNTLSLKTVISNIKTVKKGEAVGYGSEFVAKKDVLIATLPIGYADGFKCENFKNGNMIYLKGKHCPITGRVCMDQIMIDISNTEGLSVGDEVFIYGSGSEIDLEAYSIANKKIPYETMCEISARVPRVYCRDEYIESIRDSLV